MWRSFTAVSGSKNMKKLTTTQIDYALKTSLSRWQLEGDFIRRDFEFKDFVACFITRGAFRREGRSSPEIGKTSITRHYQTINSRC